MPHARWCSDKSKPLSVNRIKPRSPLGFPPNLPSTSNRRSSWLCEPISELDEPPAFDEPLLDLEPEHNKRQHKHKPLLPRTNSAPQLISTTTTTPVHIHQLQSVAFFSLFLLIIVINLDPLRTMATLLPVARGDSLSARVRGTSHIDFKTATTGVAAKSMRNEISRLVSTVDDTATKKVRLPLLNPP